MFGGVCFVSVEHENNAEGWWAALRERLEEGAPRNPRVRAACHGLLLGKDDVRVDDRDLGDFVDFVRGLPGWEDPLAPAYARTPLLFYYTRKEQV